MACAAQTSPTQGPSDRSTHLPIRAFPSLHHGRERTGRTGLPRALLVARLSGLPTSSTSAVLLTTASCTRRSTSTISAGLPAAPSRHCPTRRYRPPAHTRKSPVANADATASRLDWSRSAPHRPVPEATPHRRLTELDHDTEHSRRCGPTRTPLQAKGKGRRHAHTSKSDSASTIWGDLIWVLTHQTR